MDSPKPAASEKHIMSDPEIRPTTRLLHIYRTGGLFSRDLVIHDFDKTTPLYNVIYKFRNSFKNQRSGLEIHRAQSQVSSLEQQAPIGTVAFLGTWGRDPAIEIHGRPMTFVRPDNMLVRYEYTWQSAIGPLTWQFDYSGIGRQAVLVTAQNEWIAKYEALFARRKAARLELVNGNIAGEALDEIVITAMAYAFVVAESSALFPLPLLNTPQKSAYISKVDLHLKTQQSLKPKKMMISKHCPERLDTSEEGCVPLSYLLFPLGFIILFFLLVSFLCYRQHYRNKRAQNNNNDIDLENWSPGLRRQNLLRQNSAGTEISLPPSYHSTDEMLVTTVPAERFAREQEQDIAEQRLPPAYKEAEEEGRTSINFSRRSLRERRLSSNAGREAVGSRQVSPLRIVTSRSSSSRVVEQGAVRDLRTRTDSLDLTSERRDDDEARYNPWERRRV